MTRRQHGQHGQHGQEYGNYHLTQQNVNACILERKTNNTNIK